jgi:hypothetical protein
LFLGFSTESKNWYLFRLSYQNECARQFFSSQSPKDLDEDSILKKVVEGAAGDPQVIGGSSLAGGHQGSAAVWVEFSWLRSTSP